MVFTKSSQSGMRICADNRANTHLVAFNLRASQGAITSPISQSRSIGVPCLARI
jgi:hypothetical protein